MAKKSSNLKKIIKIILFITLTLCAIGVFLTYETAFKTNVKLDGKKSKIVLIPSNSTYEDLIQIMYDENIIDNHTSFEWLAKRMKLPENFKPGRYRIMASMNNRQLINMLNNGKQEKVRITFNSSDRTMDDIILDVSSKLEIDKDELENYLNDEDLLNEKYGLNRESIRTLFIPGVYELEWNTHLNEFFELMQNEYKKLWTSERKNLAKKIGYTQSEVITLASIVQCESGIKSEQEKIAGVYINRLKENMPLQADPTLIFARGNFKIQRVLNDDKDIDSPYNTYTNKGLPPGPICLPYTQAIDAVLNYTKHNYLYFCAKPDLSGYSNFSATYKEHQKFADEYQLEMDKRGINR